MPYAIVVDAISSGQNRSPTNVIAPILVAISHWCMSPTPFVYSERRFVLITCRNNCLVVIARVSRNIWNSTRDKWRRGDARHATAICPSILSAVSLARQSSGNTMRTMRIHGNAVEIAPVTRESDYRLLWLPGPSLSRRMEILYQRHVPRVSPRRFLSRPESELDRSK